MATGSVSAAILRGSRYALAPQDDVFNTTDAYAMKCHGGCDSAAAYRVTRACLYRHRSHGRCCRRDLAEGLPASHARCAPTCCRRKQSAIAHGLTRGGFALPDFASAELVFVPIGAPAHDFAAAHQAARGTRASSGRLASVRSAGKARAGVSTSQRKATQCRAATCRYMGFKMAARRHIARLCPP